MNTMPIRDVMDATLASPMACAKREPISRDVPLSSFMRDSRAGAQSPRQRVLGGAAAIAVQVIFFSAMIYGTMQEIVPRLDNLTVVNVIEETQVAEEELPPAPPKLETPVIEFDTPLVTIADAPPSPTAITAVVRRVQPPAPPAPAPAPVARSNSREDPVMLFQRELLRHLNRHKRYPASARAKREQGVVYVRFAMDRRGRVLRAGIERHSKFMPLNEEGLALLQRAQPLPLPPTELPGDPLEMVVPVEFSLR